MPDKPSEFNFSQQEKRFMLKIARETLDHHLKTNKTIEYDEASISSALKLERGLFVSLHQGKDLRGCIGTMQSDKPLYQLVQRYALSAAFGDPRFPGINKSELDSICIEISVLGELKKMESIEELEPGIHGVYIKSNYSSGTFLPQVAQETGWTARELLGYCAKDKACIGWNGWKNADVYLYTAVVFNEINCM